MASSSRTSTVPFSIRVPGVIAISTTRPTASGTISTDCRARVVPTASTVRARTRDSARASSTGTAVSRLAGSGGSSGK